ncbi:unnamed protein product, partial [Gongylonema pulchrum]|uniref:NR LBD domain-containing protein n=1 Tax=Gongylonema pulchrum TaxID=637853 RepID=A0A183DFS4_9BILA
MTIKQHPMRGILLSVFLFKTGIKAAVTTILVHTAGKAPIDSIHWAYVCILSNAEMITLSGSKRAGHCTSFTELYERLYPLVKRCPDLLIGNEQRNNIDRYSHTLRINCQMLATLCEFSKLERSALENTYDSVWNVLVRSRHKAVLDSCAICFGKMTAYCVTNDFSDLVYLYLEK